MLLISCSSNLAHITHFDMKTTPYRFNKNLHKTHFQLLEKKTRTNLHCYNVFIRNRTNLPK